MAAKAQPAKPNARRHVAHPTVIANKKRKNEDEIPDGTMK
jgi:hypothetical protein